jgi:hypothetical protein
MRDTARRLHLPVIDDGNRSQRHHDVRPVTLPKRMRARELAELVTYPAGVERPRTRADCYGAARPCPFVSCRYHLYTDINKSGTLRVNFPDREPGDMHPSCALDVAALGRLSLEYVAFVMNLTRERVRQLEAIALRKLRCRGDWTT